MNFASFPEEVRPIAKSISRDLKKRKLKVVLEKAPWPDSPYCPSITTSGQGSLILIEVQSHVQYHSTFKDFVRWVSSKRHNAEIFVATHKEDEISARDLQDLKADGVGLIWVEDNGKVTIHSSACNPALIVNCDPTLKFGASRKKVDEAVLKFNIVNRKDGLKDMCELVENLTESLIQRAAKKGFFKIPETSIASKDFSEQINTLGSKDAYLTGKKILFDDPFKQDMHSFRNARNLVNHKVKNLKEEYRRKRQYHDKMVMGPRLVAELVALQRTV